jgi:hypothetical protein
MKCVIVIDHTLPKGLAANTTAVLSISLGDQLSNVVGSSVVDAAGGIYPGLVHIPIPILCAQEDKLKNIRSIAMEKDDEDLRYVAVTDVAQRSKNYQSYLRDMLESDPEKIKYLGIALYGRKKAVTSITGDLPLYK